MFCRALSCLSQTAVEKLKKEFPKAQTNKELVKRSNADQAWIQTRLLSPHPYVATKEIVRWNESDNRLWFILLPWADWQVFEESLVSSPWLTTF
jgi:hypothetical protein